MSNKVAVVCVLAVAGLLAAPASAQDSLLKNVTLEYPSPAYPYYHFRAELALPAPAMIEVKASVNGQPLRQVALRDLNENIDLTRPLIKFRPTFADTYVFDTTVWQKPFIIGRVAWQPGEAYKIDVIVQKKVKGAKGFDNDGPALTGTASLTGDKDAKVFPKDWKHYKSLVLAETAGADRQAEPVDVLTAFYADEAQTLAKDLRVVAFDPQTKAVTEVPSQVYDIQHDVTQGDPQQKAPGAFGRSTYEVQIWVPTITARVAFLADVPANSRRIYLLYHDNAAAEAPNYPADVSMVGVAPGLTFEKETGVVRNVPIEIQNDKIKVGLHPHSGVLNELTLKSKPDQMLYHKMETNGSIHWAPEAYPPPRPWTHTSDWMQPNFQSASGPIVASTLVNGMLPVIPEVDAAVSYKIYAHQPYILSTTSMRVNEPLALSAMRNGEIVFKRELLTHLSWYDVIDKEIKTVDLEKVADLDEQVMQADVPWISFWNPKTGVAFGGVQIESSFAALEHMPKVWNPYYYVNVGPVIYWSRATNFTFGNPANQLLIQVPKGTFYWEKWGFVLYEPAAGESPHAPLLDWQKKLTNPLRVHLTEEAEMRVPTVGTEIYIDPSKTGWEGRETLKTKTTEPTTQKAE